MIKPLNLTADIDDDREIFITLPEDFPTGRVYITVTSENGSEIGTLGDLLESDFFGMWKDRTDITDTDTFAAELRQKAWTRQP